MVAVPTVIWRILQRAAVARKLGPPTGSPKVGSRRRFRRKPQLPLPLLYRRLFSARNPSWFPTENPSLLRQKHSRLPPVFASHVESTETCGTQTVWPCRRRFRYNLHFRFLGLYCFYQLTLQVNKRNRHTLFATDPNGKNGGGGGKFDIEAIKLDHARKAWPSSRAGHGRRHHAGHSRRPSISSEESLSDCEELGQGHDHFHVDRETALQDFRG